MGASHGHSQTTESKRYVASGFGISRSRLGWLSIRFEGGPSYPEMVGTLKEMVELHGRLVKRGERISGTEWLRRIEASGACISEGQTQAIRTLMETM